MATGAARLDVIPLPFSFKSRPSPPTPPQSSRKLAQKNHSLSIHPISCSLVKEQQQQEDQRLSFTDPEAALLEALLGIQGRGRAATPQQLMDVEEAIKALETAEGVPDPTSSGLIEGRWNLIFTTRPGTASPIQRTFVGVDFFKVFQEVYLRTNDPRVSNIVKFSEAIGELKVEAAATIKDGKRILFQFDRAAFSFKFLPFKVPYPVPFRLLGDEAKGWLDTTYLSNTGNIRISRGNKGTTFVLQKKTTEITEPRQRLVEAISLGSGVLEAIEELVDLQQKTVTETLEGEWKLLWASQSQLEGESWRAIAAYGLKGLQIVKKNGQLENQVNLVQGFSYSASGDIMKLSDSNTYTIRMDNGAVRFGEFRFPLEIKSKYNLELLYVDNKMRITRGFQDRLFVHLRLGDAKES
ncbi:putative plastid-lipid-associated protein 12, chloroplastic [Iris pallida]|uniref:Plastid-lipid-associated protein 12, chloroplastic n=1 Tax=Iris pallida TaxID=29817 RepID=A0AAX6E6T0_IRIPA|nr:putative plastid-lipid-associated protein 12, chloroplastic [Iris pallida]